VAETTELIARVLVVGLPLVLALVAGTTWLVVGRSLAPVERMRREVDRIGASDLHRRVERPASDDEIGRLAITMNRMLDRLEASQVRQRQLVADTSHELRSPIAAIRQNVEVALTHPDRIDPGALSAAVLADAERLQALVDDLLVLATIDEQSPTLRSRPVDLDDLALAEGRRLRSSTTHRVDLTGVSAARTRGDPVALARVLRNLAENAARHARSRIALTTRTLGGWAVVAVEDDGSGIPPADRERIFERFVRLDDARARDSGGGGLGLAIVRDVVAAHGGVVTAGDSSLGGARLEVRLPRADAA
jgi:signal transduction histidine kinase